MARMRREAGESLRQSEERLRLALTAARMVAWQLDPTTGREITSENAAEVFGLPAGTTLERGEQRSALIHPNDMERHRTVVTKAITACGSYLSEYRVIRPDDGAVLWMEERGHAVSNGMGGVGRLVGVVMDITERRHAEEQVRRAEQQSREILESISDAFFALDRDWRFTYVNRQAEQVLERRSGELLDQVIWDEYPGLVGSEFEPVYRQAMSERVALTITAFYPDHGRWYEVHSYPAVNGISVYFRDVTERKRAEEALREAERRWRNLAEALPNLVWTDLPDGQCDYLSAQWETYTGIPEEELLGLTWLERVIHPDDRERTLACWTKAVADEGMYDLEYRIRRHDGIYRWFKTRGVPIRDALGRIVKWFGTCTDIEDQKQAQAALRENQERLRIALAASDTGTFRWNPQTGEFFGFDDNLKRLFGFAPEDQVRLTENFVDRVHPDDRTRLAAAVDRSRRGADFEMEYRVILPDGSVRWLYDRAKMVRDDAGRPAYLVGACTDITKRKQVEEALKDADRRKDEFLATLAHELRNPLAPIRNALHLMRRTEGDGPMESDRAMAERHVVHLARLIDDLMDVARISRGKLVLHKQVLDLHTVVRQAVETARTQIDDRRHHLSVTLPEESIRLEADPTRLEQILWNLLNNAAKYTEPGGQITLSAVRDRGEVVVRVRDTGIGIEPEMLPRLFQMFVQVGEHRKHAQGGLGIGLNLVRRLVKMHGGSIEVHSMGSGTGSEFVVRLPAIPAGSGEPDRPVRDRRRATEPALPRRRILVVDDNVDAANSLAKLLSRIYGQEVRVAHDGPSALGLVEGFQPEIVLLDIGLPGMDGHEVARRLRARPDFERTLLVALTGWGQETDRQKSREAGFDRHLVKPVDPVTLLDLLAGQAEART